MNLNSIHFSNGIELSDEALEYFEIDYDDSSDLGRYEALANQLYHEEIHWD